MEVQYSHAFNFYKKKSKVALIFQNFECFHPCHIHLRYHHWVIGGSWKQAENTLEVQILRYRGENFAKKLDIVIDDSLDDTDDHKDEKGQIFLLALKLSSWKLKVGLSPSKKPFYLLPW